MNKDKIDNKEKSGNKILDFILRVVIVFTFIVLIVYIYNAFFNNNEYVDLSSPDLIKIDNGYRKDIEFTSVVDSKKLKKVGTNKEYIITCFDGDIKYEIKVQNYLFNHLSENEEISVKGSIYYSEKGLKLSDDLEVKSLVDDDSYGIVDIPDGYKEPEFEKIDGVDYGD